MTLAEAEAAYSVCLSLTPDPADFRTLFAALDQATASVAGPVRLRPLALLLRDADGTTIGGLWGRLVYTWLAIELLFVPAPLRGRGLGARLLAQAEAAAVGQGCSGAQVTAFDFQAPGFYTRSGYSVFGVQEDAPPGHRCLYLSKRLT